MHNCFFDRDGLFHRDGYAALIIVDRVLIHFFEAGRNWIRFRAWTVGRFSGHYEHGTLRGIGKSAVRRRGKFLQHGDKFIGLYGSGQAPAAEDSANQRADDSATAPWMPAKVNQRYV